MSRLYPLLCIAVFVAAGCGSSTNASPPLHHNVAVLQWGLVGVTDVQTLDPALAVDATSISAASLVYGGLVRLDRHLQVRPDGADRWTISPDGRVYTFYIRHNLRFPDGARVTAADFAAALNRALGPESSSGTGPFYLGLITHHSSVFHGTTRTTRGIAVLNRSTLRITLTQPAAHFLAQLAFPASFVIQPGLQERYGPSWTDHAAGFGPFFVAEWRHGRHLRLERNPYYYGGRPALKRIILHFYEGRSSALAAYDAGSLDLVSGFQAGQSIARDVTGTRRVPGLALDYLAFNTSRLPFFRLNARRAFASVWETNLASRAMGSTAYPARGFLPIGFGVTTGLWRPVQSGSWYLARARFPRAGHFPHVALVMLRDRHVYALAQLLQAAWSARLGVDVSIEQLNPSNYSAVLNRRAFDLAIVRWGADYPDPQDFLATQLGRSPANVTGWTGRPYQALIAAADSRKPTDVSRATLFQRAAEIAARKVPLLPLDQPALTAVVRPALSHVYLTQLGTITGDWVQVGLST